MGIIIAHILEPRTQFGDKFRLGGNGRFRHLLFKKTGDPVTAMSRAKEAQREILRHTYKDPKLSPEEKIARVRAVYDALDIPRLTEQQISVRFDRALTMLDEVNVPDFRKEPLREYARSLMNRKK